MFNYSLLKKISTLSISAVTVLGFVFSNHAYADQTSTDIFQAQADHTSVITNKSASISVLSNDKGQNLKISAVSHYSQENAQIIINLSKTKVTYIPEENFSGHDSFWYEVTDKNLQKQTALVTIDVSPLQLEKSKGLNFDLIPIHYKLLNDEPHTWQEYEGLTSFSISSDAPKGQKQLSLTKNSNLHPSELVVYKATSGRYHVAQVSSRNGSVVTLTKSLEEDVASGSNLWNFYSNAAHPNTAGYKALADFALSQLDITKLQNKAHAFIGDSWFEDKTFENRIISKVKPSLTTNKALGGREASNTLNSFDEDFPSNAAAPDFVWVALGTNDYWNKVSADAFINNLTKIIQKINQLGAKAIVLDSSVGPYIFDDVLNQNTTIHKDLSDAYATKLLKLYNDNKGSPITPPPTSNPNTPSTPTPSTPAPSTPTPTSSGKSGGGSMFIELLLFVGLLARKIKLKN